MRRRLLFVFQGRQGFRVGMGRGLYRAEPVFRDTVRRCSETVEERLGIKLVDAFEDDHAARLVHESQFHSILTHAIIHLGLSVLWLSKGVTPDATIGLSLGEITSPFVTGALTVEEVMAVARAAAQWDERLLARGKILLLGAGLPVVRSLCRDSPAAMSCFAEYGRSTTEVFCLIEDVPVIKQFLTRRGIPHKVYLGDFAYHTPRFAVCKEIMAGDLRHLDPQPPRYPFYSSLAGGLIPPSVLFDATYWYWMLAKPVLFNTALESALTDGYDTILNIGPQPSLAPHLAEAITGLDKDVVVLDSMRSDEPEPDTFNRTLARLRAYGRVAGRRPPSSPSEGSPPGDVSPVRVSAGRLSLTAPEVTENPYPFYSALRRRGPVHFLEQHDGWLVLDHRDVTAALGQPRVFATHAGGGTVDAVSPRELCAHAGQIRIWTDALLDRTGGEAIFDVVSTVAVPLAERVIGTVAGLEGIDLATTTSALVGIAVLSLFQQPHARAELEPDRPAFLPPFVDEVWRMDPPEQTRWCRALCDVEIAGVRIPAGARVGLCLAGASRDPARYDRPDSFMLGRQDRDPRSPGDGGPTNVGREVASLVAQIALEAILARHPTIRAAEALATVRYVPSDRFRSLARLMVTSDQVEE